MSVKFSNNAVTTLSAGISAGATSFTVASASTFPTLGASDWTYVSLTSEVVKVTAISGTTFTCDATSGAHASGESVELRMTAEILNDVALGDDESLDAISNASAITGNAVDVFIYDTSNDSDGGAWRKRTQATSWYNETLNTATRGSRKEFPSVAVIVAEAYKVTIYDGDTPDLDMWMVFTAAGGLSGAANNLLTGVDILSISALNAEIAVGQNSTSNRGGLRIVELISDSSVTIRNDTDYSGKRGGYLVDRNTSGFANTGGVQVIVQQKVNDVAMTVLPNAPIDSTTGLPIPTIAVATDGGVSVIKDDGTVVDLTTTIYTVASSVDFTPEDNLIFALDNVSNTGRYVHVHAIPAIDTLIGANGYDKGSSLEFYTARVASNPDLYPSAVLASQRIIYADDTLGGSDTGLARLLRNTTTPDNGSVAYITSTYNSGYMTGDIKGAWLSDTDDTNVVGTELVTNGDFASDTSWTKGAGWTISGGGAVASNVQSGIKIRSTSFTLATGWYTITVDVNTSASTYFFGVDGTTNDNTGVLSTQGTASFTAYLLAGTYTAYIGAWSTGLIGTFDNLSLKLADADRSVNGNGLQVNGTITKTAVATGADLVAYSGFSTSNYLEQPYNADLDFGTGDFSIMGWVNCPLSGDDVFANKTDRIPTYGSGNPIRVYSSGSIVSFTVGAADANTPQSLTGAGWSFITATRASGVLFLYINGEQRASAVSTHDVTSIGGNDVLLLGVGTYNGTAAWPAQQMALWRISATAPTAAQIKEIYEAEKPLFQENAKCTLNGTSDAVQCLAYDDSTSELVVGTSSSLSVFKGLRRVDEELGNFTEVSQQGGMRITEKA